VKRGDRRRTPTAAPSDGRRAASVVHRVALLVLRAVCRAGRPAGPADLQRLVLVVHTAFGMGGTIRATITQANRAAAEGRHVTLVSVTRAAHQPQPFFHVDERVQVRVLDDPLERPARFGPRRLLSALPGVLFHPLETRSRRMTLWRDLVLVRELRRHRDGVVVGTRAGLNVIIAHACRAAVVRVGQEHVPFASYPQPLLDELARSYPQLHGLMLLTRADADVARTLLSDAGLAIRVIPNALPDAPSAVSDGTAHVIVTAGRLSRGKRQDVLIRAFARVADRHPSWQVRIYGDGPRRERLTKLVQDLGLEGRVELMGSTSELGLELGRSSIFVLSSEMEAFGIVLIEAMRSRLAVISTACDHGPREIITDGTDGILVPINDPQALAKALDRVMARPERREELAAAAQRTSQRYEASAVSTLWWETYRAAEQARTRGALDHDDQETRVG
jgi:glycosyltransferase involved in cell wall biosynthesis